MPRRFVRFAAARSGVVFKSLLQTGTEGTGFQYWVGGDRAVPFGPLPTPTTSNTQLRPATIQATGPGLDDWVVCYSVINTGAGFNGGPNLAFADATGVIGTREIFPPAGPLPFLVVTSKGNFASYRVGTDDEDDVVQGWSTPTDQETETIPVDFLSISNFILPDVFISLYGTAQGISLSDFSAIDPTLSHAINQRTTAPILYSATAAPVTLSPAIPGLSPTANRTALVSLVLHQADGEQLSAAFLENELGGTTTVDVSRWQIAEDGTWAALDPVQGQYREAAGYVRLDFSFYPAA